MILVTGADGYLGWPVLLKLARTFPDEPILGLDHGGRRKWVDEVGSVSAIPVFSMEERTVAAHEYGMDNLSLVYADLTSFEKVVQLLKEHRPRAVVHLAAQPSAPYSHMNAAKAGFTQENNTRICRNFLWGLYELGLKDCHFIETTTTGIYGTPEIDIPEGFLEVEGWNGGKVRLPYPGMATSWYHMSKSHDVNNLYLAHHMWHLPITDLRTAIVYGTQTEETVTDERFATRFDFDFYFGVLPNRFVAQVLAHIPITVYGKGNQKKPLIHLQDAVCSTVNAVQKGNSGSLEVYNQFTHLVSPRELASTLKKVGEKCQISVSVRQIPNPRVEKEDHDMVMYNERFMRELMPTGFRALEQGLKEMLGTLCPYAGTIVQHKDHFLSSGF